jgi:phenylpropionate dioxygenase-like ring-hydroxylating dioxygenase large terminal subunit
MKASDQPLFLRNIWYYAMHGTHLKAGKLVQKQIAGEKIVIGRNASGDAFAMKDNCPHRGVPLSHGWFDGETITCCYHGWQFNCDGECQNIPALPDDKMDVRKIKVFQYPCKEINGTIWVYVPQNMLHVEESDRHLPDLLLDPAKKFWYVETVIIPTNIDHAVIGLIDPAHVTFVHQSWFWRSAKNLKLKVKHFEPVDMGFKMVRHKPSANSKGYSVLRGGTSTEINFQLPGNRIEHIQVGDKNEVISITTLTPIDENRTELNHIFYTSLGLAKMLWLPLRRLGRKFIGQDLGVFQKLSEGLDANPTLMLLGDPDTQARWYYELKKQWNVAQFSKTPFVNSLEPQTLRWVT